MAKDELQVVQQDGISGLMQTAVSSGMSPEGLEKLFGLYERQRNHDAAVAWANAMADFQASAPVIIKNRLVNTGKYSYSYAELDHVAGIIRPMLQQHGLSYRFDSELTDKAVTVHCIVTHALGHSERTSFSCPVGGMAGINGGQQTASALSYARRYALLLAFGLSTGDKDDDGMGDATLNPKQLAAINDLLNQAAAGMTAEDEVAMRQKFLAWIGVGTVEEIPADRFKVASDELIRKINRSKAA